MKIPSTLTISLDVANTGSRDGSEVVQLYFNYPPSAGEPPKVLRGFNKITLAAGASTNVNFLIQNQDIAIWNVNTHVFSVVTGVFGILVGSSSRDIRLTGSFNVTNLEIKP